MIVIIRTSDYRGDHAADVGLCSIERCPIIAQSPTRYEIKRLKVKCNRYAKHLVRLGFDGVVWEETKEAGE